MLSLATGLAIAAATVNSKVPLFQSYGGSVGTAVSGTFLVVIGVLNLLVLLDVLGVYRRMKRGHYDEQKAEIQKYLGEGKDRTGVLEAFVAQYGGQHILAAPLDRGFNRLAWIVPYVAGVLGLVLAGLAAVRWSRRAADQQVAVAGGGSVDDAALDARLNDELRDLD